MTTEERPTEPAPSAPPTQLPPPPALSPFVEMQQQVVRPISPRVIAVLFFLGALVELSNAASSQSNPVYAVFCLVFAGIFTMVGLGLVQYRTWAPRWAIIALLVRFAFMVIYTVFTINKIRGVVPPELGPAFLPIVLIISFSLLAGYFGTMIFFLTRPAVKAACDR